MGRRRNNAIEFNSLVQTLARPFQAFLRLESRSGILVCVSAACAVAWMNSPWAHAYTALWETPVALRIGSFHTPETLLHLINDGLMSFFFLVVGLEIRREMADGELSDAKRAMLPVLAALGGMIVPASLYLLLTRGTGASSGWGIPMATDIAFSLGVLTLLGDRVPLQLKVFLTALAIVDDIGAVLVIALFYATGLSWIHLGAAGLFLAAMALLARFRVRSLVPFAICGLVLWASLIDSGIHPSVAGILLALMLPAAPRNGGRAPASPENGDASPIRSAAQRAEQALHPWVTYGIVPLFVLANAGIALDGGIGPLAGSRVALSVLLALAAGKQAGIFLFARFAEKARLATLPATLTWRHIYGAAWLGGIGFTMSIFIADLAFGLGPLTEMARGGIYGASLMSAVGGLLVLLRARPAPLREPGGSEPAAAPDHPPEEDHDA